NVFDIMQGVSINIFVKTGKKKKNELAKILHCDLYGKREVKYDFLKENNLKSVSFKELQNVAPNYFFVPKNFSEENEYSKGFKVDELFKVNSVGVVTSCDNIVLSDKKNELKSQIQTHFENCEFNDLKVKKYLYRPFEEKFIYYDPKYLGRARETIMKHFNSENIGSIVSM